MTKSRYFGLAVLFLAIAMFVSGSLVMTLHAAYGGGGQSFVQTIEKLQRA